MENPKRTYGHAEWPPKVSIEAENINEGCYDMPKFYDPTAEEQVKEKYERGAC